MRKSGLMRPVTKRNILYTLALLAALSSYYVEAIGRRGFQLPLIALAALLAFWGYASPSREEFDD